MDNLLVTAVDALSANGGSVSLVGSDITYIPPAGFAGVDSFDYTVTDGIWGGSDTGTVVVTIPTSLEIWRVANGFAADGSGTNEGNLEDFEIDGLSNLLEFGFGTDPTSADNVALSWDGVNPVVPGTPMVDLTFSGGANLKARFMRRKDHGTTGSASYAWEFSSGPDRLGVQRRRSGLVGGSDLLG